MSRVSTVISAFSEDHVERLTGISKRQLRYWDSKGFFVPSLAYENRRNVYSRVYSFRDVVCLQVLNALRNEYAIPLWHLEEVKNTLRHLGDDLWAKTRLYVLNKRVIVDNPETQRKEEVVSKQGALEIPLEVIRGNMQERVKDLWARDSADIGRIECRRGIARNQPVIAGTRIPVQTIREFQSAGYTNSQIREQYPALTDEDIEAALRYDAAA